MPELELTMFCENCGSSCRMIYESEDVSYEPENCPFCGEIIGSLTHEAYDDEDEVDEDEDEDDSWN